MWDLCDRLPGDVSVAGCHGQRRRSLRHVIHIAVLTVMRDCLTRPVSANPATCHSPTTPGSKVGLALASDEANHDFTTAMKACFSLG